MKEFVDLQGLNLEVGNDVNNSKEKDSTHSNSREEDNLEINH